MVMYPTRNSVSVVFATLILVLLTAPTCFSGKAEHKPKLNPKFYHKSCPDVETIVQNVTWSKVKANRTLAAKLLRLHFHDCFVRGCDASVLLDSIGGNNTVEKDATPNLSLAGFDVIDEIKSKVEEKCPNTVSCADILALAARDAVSYQFGMPMWDVFTGRGDGRVSSASEALSKIPSPGSNFTTLEKQFSDNDLDVMDLVALSGAHTIGVAHCAVFRRRLFNFTGKGDTDPSLDPEYAKELKAECATPATIVEMDPGSNLTFDSHYFIALKQNKGLFQSDAALLTDGKAASFAEIFQKFPVFMAQFGKSMRKMGEIGVLTQKEGEVRKNCRVVN